MLAQLRAADLLVVSKTDLVEPAALADVRDWLREVVGPSTSIVEAAFGDVPTDVLIGARPHRGPAPPPRTTTSTTTRALRRGASRAPPPLAGAGLVEAIAELPDGIVRAKGFLHLREDAASRYVLQLVGRRYSIEPDRPWGDEEPASRLVVIGLPGSVDAAALDATMARLSVRRAERRRLSTTPTVAA